MPGVRWQRREPELSGYSSAFGVRSDGGSCSSLREPGSRGAISWDPRATLA